MGKLEKLYEGKAKQLYATDDPECSVGRIQEHRHRWRW